MQGVGSSAIANPNLSPPSLPHLVDLLNLPNLAYLLTQNAIKALSSGQILAGQTTCLHGGPILPLQISLLL